MAEVDTPAAASEPTWRERAVSRSVDAARTRAEQRVQRYLDAAFELIDEKGTTEFTIQEVVERSQQSLRTFYHYFAGKDELVLALFEETVRETTDDLRRAVDAETEPLARLRAFTICLHQWCEPGETHRKRGTHNRRPIAEFVVALEAANTERVAAALAPISKQLIGLIEAAAATGAITVADTHRAAALVQQQVMYTWTGSRLVQDPRMRVDAEAAWEFCLHGLRGVPA